jgi:exonuclease SbcC
MLLIKELKLINFISHENTTIVLGENDKVLLEGKSGSGKSAITDAILFALYGRGRTENRGLVRRGTKIATVSLKLTEGNREMAITRTVSSAGKNTLSVTENRGKEGQFLPIETTGLKDTQTWIEKTLLKASYELFTNSIAYPQENESSFVKATASNRKDLLLELVGAGNFDDLYDKTNAVIRTNELENATTLVKVNNLEIQIKANQEIADKKNQFETDYIASADREQKLILTESELEKSLNATSSLEKELKDIKFIRLMIIEAISKNKRQVEKDRVELEEHNKIDIVSLRKDVEESELLQKEESEINKKLFKIGRAHV